MNLPYFAADTLGVTLHLVKGRLVASEMHPLFMGPWRVDQRIDVESDVMSTTELGFWVTIERTLRLYVVIREKENFLFVLHMTTLKECGQKTGFAGTTVKDRMLEFAPAIKGIFRYEAEKWTKVEYDGSSAKE
jgi:hypothetical protein